jgi:hypothetical protein
VTQRGCVIRWRPVRLRLPVNFSAVEAAWVIDSGYTADMPRTVLLPRIAYVLAFVIAALMMIAVASGQLLSLPLVAVFLVGGVGIVRAACGAPMGSDYLCSRSWRCWL